MNSCIYLVKVGHARTIPKKNSFSYGMYMFYINLDELDKISKRFLFFSYNRFNIHSFFDKDHFFFVKAKSQEQEIIAKEKINFDPKKYHGQNTKEKIQTMIGELALDFELGQVFLLTNLRNFGYVFNPVSFYYCYDQAGKFRVLFSEVNNTFGEQKMYYYLNEDFNKTNFQTKQVKNYYISPFIDFDTTLYWDFELPNEKLTMRIKSAKEDKIYLSTSLVGQRREITNWSLTYILLRYPLVTLMVIFRIHYQAIKLWSKKVGHYGKKSTDQKISEALIKQNNKKNV